MYPYNTPTSGSSGRAYSYNLPTSGSSGRAYTPTLERYSLFRLSAQPFRPKCHPKPKKKKKVSLWQHDFICLSHTWENKVPSPMEKANLIRAGRLSPEFHDDLLHAYPKLNDAGGYELMRSLLKGVAVGNTIPRQEAGAACIK